MLTVNKKPVVAGVGELLSDGWAVAVDEYAEFGFASGKISLELGSRFCQLHNHIPS
jgi:hypothetical protein